MATGTDFDAVVVGAGPSGTSTAILLANAGWRVALVEKQPFPRRKVCGECIAATNLPLLDALGVGATVAALAGPPLRRVALMHGERTISAALPAFANDRHPWGRALRREHLDTLLRDQAIAQGVTVLQPWMVRGIAERDGVTRCDVQRTQSTERLTLTSQVLVAAHGSWELAPPHQDHAARRHAPARASDLFAFKANFRHAALPDGLLPVLAFPGGYGGMVVGDDDTLTLACCIRRDQLAQCRAATDRIEQREHGDGSAAGDAVGAALGRGCRGVRETLCDAEQCGAWLAVGPLRPGIRIGRNDDAIFRVGNAAGEAHPIIGEGMSMAFQSAWLLAGLLTQHKDRLSDATGRRTLARHYASAWRRHFAGRIRLAALFAHVAMRGLPANCAMGLLQRYPALLTHGARFAGKVRSEVHPCIVDGPGAHPGQPGPPCTRPLA